MFHNIKLGSYWLFLVTVCDIELKSWGFTEADQTGHIIVNDVTILSTAQSNGDRGMALKVIDPVTCVAVSGGSWDLWATQAEAHSMRDFLLAQPDGTLVVGVTMDTASVYVIK